MTDACDRTVLPESLRSDELLEGDDLCAGGHVEEALTVYQKGFDRDDLPEYHFARSVFVKRIVDLLVHTEGPSAPMAYYRLHRLDNREMSTTPADIACVAVVRDEGDQLPYFLEYYERLGVDRFLFIDNGSVDDTCDLLLSHPKVHLWSSEMEYWDANSGIAWAEVVLRAQSVNSWCVTVDADEFLYYPDVETTSIHDFCSSLEATGKKAFSALLLDMYSDGPIRQAECHRGQNPFEVCRYFDREVLGHEIPSATPWKNFRTFSGGVRQRALGAATSPFLGKVPLVRYSSDRILCTGWHGTNVPPEEMATETGVLLHASFTSKFASEVERQILWRSKWRHQGQSYHVFAQVLEEHPMLSVFDLTLSAELRGSGQLVELGLMRSRSSPVPFVTGRNLEDAHQDDAGSLQSSSEMTAELEALRKRLAHIEGTRTWRLRAKVGRVVARLRRRFSTRL